MYWIFLFFYFGSLASAIDIKAPPHTSWSAPGNPEQPVLSQGHGFRVSSTAMEAQFDAVGNVVPTRGFAHLQSVININQHYRAADQALKVARKIFVSHLQSQGITMESETIPPVQGLALPAPPRPEEIFTLRNDNYIRDYIEGDPKKFQATQAIKAYHYLSPQLRTALVSTYSEWHIIDKQVHPQWLDFDLFVRTKNPALLSTIRAYLEVNNGPYPHIRQNHGLSIFNVSENNFALDFGQLLHRAAMIKLEAAAQLDLTQKLGASSIYGSRLYNYDEQIPTPQGLSEVEVLNKYQLLPFSNKPSVNQSPNPAYIPRKKRAFPFILIALVVLSASAFTNTVMGSYSVEQLGRLDDQLAKQDKNLDLITRQVDRMDEHLNKVYMHLDELTLEFSVQIQQLRETVQLIRVANSLSHHLGEIQHEITKTSSLLDALANNRVSSAFASSYALTRTLRQLKTDAAKQGNELLIHHYADVFQCEASFSLSAGCLHIYVHIPLGKPSEKMTLWNFEPFPFTGYNGSISYIEKTSQALATTEDMGYFRAFSPEELSRCNKMYNTYVCPVGMILREAAALETHRRFLERSPEMCLYALLSDRLHLVRDVCTLTVSPPATITSQLTQDSFRVATQISGEGKVTCPNKPPEFFTLHPNFDIQLKTGCQCSFGTYYLFGGDILQVTTKLQRSVTMDWDPADLFGITNAEIRFRDHTKRITRSITTMPWLPEPLDPAPTLMQKVFDVQNRPVEILTTFMVAVGSLLIAFVALIMFCCFYKTYREQVDAFALRATNSVLDVARNLRRPSRQSDAGPRRSSDPAQQLEVGGVSPNALQAPPDLPRSVSIQQVTEERQRGFPGSPAASIILRRRTATDTPHPPLLLSRPGQPERGLYPPLAGSIYLPSPAQSPPPSPGPQPSAELQDHLRILRDLTP